MSIAVYAFRFVNGDVVGKGTKPEVCGRRRGYLLA